jgi:regulator of RNase E activity RraB
MSERYKKFMSEKHRKPPSQKIQKEENEKQKLMLCIAIENEMRRRYPNITDKELKKIVDNYKHQNCDFDGWSTNRH